MVKFQPENKPGIILHGWMPVPQVMPGSETQERGLIVYPYEGAMRLSLEGSIEEDHRKGLQS